jgi:DNA polymerase-3 subunit alpha
VNHSHFKFDVNDDGHIVYGLGAIKGLGEGPIDAIVEARDAGGAFRHLFDFCKRVDMKKLNRRALEALIRAGALDDMGADRSVMMASLDDAIRGAEQAAENANFGMADLFGALEPAEDQPPRWLKAPAWTPDEQLQGEKDTLGLYLTGHPVDQYEAELSHFITSRICDVKPSPGGRESRQANKGEGKTVVAGLVIASRVMKSKRGDKMGFFTLDDRSGRLEVSVFSDVYEQYHASIVKDAILVVEGDVSHDDFSGGLKMVARKLLSIGQARESFARFITVRVGQELAGSQAIEHLRQSLQAYKLQGAECRVRVDYACQEARGSVLLGDAWRVRSRPDLLQRLEKYFGDRAVTVQYRQTT